MENSPLNIDTDKDSEKKESKSKKKKTVELGAFAVEPQRTKEKTTKPTFESAVESETTAPLEHLAEPEKQFAEREFTKAEQAADLEPVEAVERFRNRIIIEGQDSDAALTETLAELQDLPDVENNPAETAAHEAADETLKEADDAPHEFGEEVILLNEQDAPAAEDVTTEDEFTGSTTTSTKAVVVPSAGGASMPPHDPVGHNGLGGAFGSYVTSPGFNAAPIAPHTVEYRRGNTAGAALVGGVVGYLIGRRRGRIKTEKRLIPVQKKLQKEVIALQTQLQQKEAKIRGLAATKVQENLKPVVEKGQKAPEINYAEQVLAKVPERPGPAVRAPAAEANQLHGKLHAPEQIGHVLVGAEASTQVLRLTETVQNVRSVEKPQHKFEKHEEPLLSVEKNIDTLNRVDLLNLSEKIIIDGSSLRQIYESRLVGEKGLRRLVKEHLKGGDVKKALRREIVEREIDFERDPGLRDQVPQAAAPKGGGRAATLNDLLQNADIAVGEDQEEVAFLKARSAYEDQQRERKSNSRRLMDVSLVVTILVLLGFIVMLVLNHQ